MYITITNPTTQTVTVYDWDVPTPTDEEVQVLIEALGYHWDEINYFTSLEEPVVSSVEIADILPDFTITKQRNEQ